MIKDQLVTRQGYDNKNILWDNIELPVVVKDPVGGSSIGIWVCKDKTTLQNAITEAFETSAVDTLLLEEFVSGEEITAAVLYGKALPIVAIRPKNEFFDLEAKYTKGKTDYLVPAPISDAATLSAQNQAVLAYNELGMRGIARADFCFRKMASHVFWKSTPHGMTATSFIQWQREQMECHSVTWLSISLPMHLVKSTKKKLITNCYFRFWSLDCDFVPDVK